MIEFGKKIAKEVSKIGNHVRNPAKTIRAEENEPVRNLSSLRFTFIQLSNLHTLDLND